MESKDQIKRAIYAALVRSGHEMGENLKSVSWFGRNHKSLAHADGDKVVALEVA